MGFNFELSSPIWSCLGRPAPGGGCFRNESTPGSSPVSLRRGKQAREREEREKRRGEREKRE